MLRRSSSSSRPGFTTIESLIASVVFLVGLAGLLSALIQARSATGQARRLMQATDIANDLSEQLQLWDFADTRLADSGDLCGKDPMDKTNTLLKPTSGGYTAYRECMHGELTLTMGGKAFGGLKTPVFTDADKTATYFERFYIVRTQEVRAGVWRKQIWVKVLYRDAGEPRVVTTQTLRMFMGGA